MVRTHAFTAAAFVILLAEAAPAFAGLPATPAPIAGVGLGAVALIGLGYRALKRRAQR
ncbi:hypothetical protein [Sphingomonas psychrolutea]|uniref:Uncharacterized protein n=1 Tax=Sphingomonas psychrolutea TaxID=1259676 RepID=A0ABQ1GHU6_9SPHN|nr:hypothetical protein [Sphingomonas psychrolutea]GGA44195.1 hypothetical protein GCM10011395_13000 [Sphingomonas psychrolutea]